MSPKILKFQFSIYTLVTITLLTIEINRRFYDEFKGFRISVAGSGGLCNH